MVLLGPVSVVAVPSGFVPVVFLRSGAGMDSSWVLRLTDERPGLSCLVEYARALRLLSGLCSLGCVRARREAMTHQFDSEFRANMLASPAVMSFLDFVNEFSANELPIVPHNFVWGSCF